MPAVTAALFRQAELRAEGLVGLLRMIAVLALLLSSVLATREAVAHEGSEVMARQWFYAGTMMAGYFTLGALAWWGYRRGWLRIWMIWPAAAADCLFFLYGVWMSMVNIGLPGGHAFVFPAVWLAPVVLAFGVLRFNPGIQAFIAALTVGGLALLIGLPPGEGFAPRSGAAAIFLSFPPNAMRVAMLGLAGAVLVVAAVRTRRLLLRSITEAQNAANLTRYLPGQLAPRLAAGGLDELRRGGWKQAGVLFIDLRGFTRLSQGMTAQELADFATEYRRRITAAAQQTGGIVDKFMGDAAMIVFEEGGDRAAAARACVDCAFRLRTSVADWSGVRVAAGAPPLRAGIGLHWGAVFSGVVGTSDRLEYSVFGDTVNIAARLEEETKRLEADILASRDILALAGQGSDGAPWDISAETELRGRDGVLHLGGVRRS
ncbi:adenylate/guanylate cyclase domain-containing protein [Antarcticimicrobium luteum]|uniref:Adenylate/guanylate cyclase domain-containing protein n=1 Tax=Antarcticimicrobium luteum TaxID=2547397 RepID=A0A4R5V3E3_9RHOB|nr:adenylate/guanylate cyclase domain-containing protein [Antarcticimicrobium luteum]